MGEIDDPGASELPEYSDWHVLYPNYIDSNKSIPEGRRIGKEKGVPNPYPQEMAEICQLLKIRCILEDKRYPREWLVPGRLRVELKRAGHFVHPEIKTSTI